ncbi:MAG: hypothetical protein JXQ73_14250 [Phycisphaerae bacterium]|nr:hypothetical protein [Phycisphaerae bacterium]
MPKPRIARNHLALWLLIAATCLSGCGLGLVFQDLVDPACLEPNWIAEATKGVTVQPEVFRAVLAELLADVQLVDGNWQGDQGDARFYAPAVLLGLAHESRNPCLNAFAQASLEGNRALIRGNSWRLVPFWTDVPDEVMATYGLVEAYRYDPRRDDVALINSVLDRLDAALRFFDNYPDALGESLLSYYGTTVQTAAIATLNLRYGLIVGKPRGPERIATGLDIIEAVDRYAYDADTGTYRFSGATDGLYLYPNVMMIVANCMAYRATEEIRYLDRAVATFERLAPLKDQEKGNYRSPYSAQQMGAQTEDYSTLSSQLYLVQALSLLHESTADEDYLSEARGVIDFICNYLRDGGRLLHHWIDGRPAGPQDATEYCTGCNFQALYQMWYLSNPHRSDHPPTEPK